MTREVDKMNCALTTLFLISLMVNFISGVSKKNTVQVGIQGGCELVRRSVPAGLIGAYTPQCSDDGWYNSRQCHGSSVQCWCVTREGVELNGTRTLPGSDTINCDVDNYTTFLKIRTEDVNFTSLTIQWHLKLAGDNNSHVQKINKYVVKYFKSDDGIGSCIVAATLPSNVTSFTLDGLDVGTMYSVYVANSENLLSPVLTNITLGFGSNNPCDCDFVGAVPAHGCDPYTGWCVCINSATVGAHCDVCVPGAVRGPAAVACSPCACPADRSNGNCTLDNGTKKCQCNAPFYGVRCEIVCNCNGNEQAERGAICSTSGQCLSCDFETTGHNCEQCLPGYVGSAQNRTCTNNASVGGCELVRRSVPAGLIGAYTPQCSDDGWYNSRQCHGSSGQCWCVTREGVELNGTRTLPGANTVNCDGGHAGRRAGRHASVVIVALGCVAAVLLLTVAAAVLYRRWRRPQRPLQLWTVKLRDDHEDVNFSSLVEQPEFNHTDGTLLIDGPHHTGHHVAA